jgi:hypothetical protein
VTGPVDKALSATVGRVSRMSKPQLAAELRAHGGLLTYKEYLAWSHDDLVNEVLAGLGGSDGSRA